MVISLLPSKDYLRCVWIIHGIALYALWTSEFSWGIICSITGLLWGSFYVCRQFSMVRHQLFFCQKGVRVILDAGLWWMIESPSFKKRMVIFKDQIPAEQRHRWCLWLRNVL